MLRSDINPRPSGPALIRQTEVAPALTLNPAGFEDWSGLLQLMRQAFAHTIGKVDPPSTVYSLTPEDLASRAEREHLLLATDQDQLVGCLFLGERPGELFLGRFALHADYQGSGLARRMVEMAAELARHGGRARLALETRTTLLGNQARFRTLGFEITGGRAHAGHHGITTYRMARRLD